MLWIKQVYYLWIFYKTQILKQFTIKINRNYSQVMKMPSWMAWVEGSIKSGVERKHLVQVCFIKSRECFACFNIYNQSKSFQNTIKTRHSAQKHYRIVILSIVILTIIILSTVILSFVILSIVILSINGQVMWFTEGT